jgi:hypothetical protein
MSEDEARKYPDLMEIVEEKVKGTRGRHSTAPWWQFERLRGELFKAIAKLDRVLVNPLYGSHLSFIFLPSQIVFANKLNVMPFDSYSNFSVLQCRVHEIWARFFSSTLKDDLAYAPSDCFETFPFPLIPDPSPTEEKSQKILISPSPNLEEELGERVVEVSPSSPTLLPASEKGAGGAGAFLSPSPSMGEGLGERETLETIGKQYYEYRAQLMIRNNEGLTDTYNRFHNPQENHPDILKLRQLHTQMDLAVLKAYGWEDLDTTCGFALDYLDLDEDSDIPPEAQDRIASGDYFFPTAEEAIYFDNLISTGKRKLPWRYRWCETTHDEVLARLLDLNQSRYEEEILGGKTKPNNYSRSRGQPKSKRKSSSDPPTIPGLF